MAIKETPNMGNRFDEWCIKYGRNRPSQEIIDALNTDLITGVEAVKRYTREQNLEASNVYRDFITFSSGRGNK